MRMGGFFWGDEYILKLDGVGATTLFALKELIACDVKITSFKVFKRGVWESAV